MRPYEGCTLKILHDTDITQLVRVGQVVKVGQDITLTTARDLVDTAKAEVVLDGD